jgi:beta-lactamase regulating signal transducer with metallopeptidase domain
VRDALVLRRRLAGARVLEERRLGLRTVRVLVSDGAGAVPCAGGVLRPWICVPPALVAALSIEEREAVIAHELAHVRHHDVVLLLAVGLARAVFGFVPGAGRLARAIREQCEVAADAAAAATVPRTALASAIVRVADQVRRAPCPPEHRLAIVRPGSVLARRVRTLLDEQAPPGARWRVALRVLGVAVVAATVFRATTFGNP